ncbi:MAG: hypothetical protein ABEK36_04580 [Candidatus Aenigmatarchaeota archaeon]
MSSKGKVNTNVKLPVEHRDFLEKEAKKRGETLSEYLRALVNAFYKVKQTTEKLDGVENEGKNRD